jgi:hypothetical protein
MVVASAPVQRIMFLNYRITQQRQHIIVVIIISKIHEHCGAIVGDLMLLELRFQPS